MKSEKNYILKSRNNYQNYFYEINDNDLSKIYIYENCYVRYNNKKYFVKSFENEGLRSRIFLNSKKNIIF